MVVESDNAVCGGEDAAILGQRSGPLVLGAEPQRRAGQGACNLGLFGP